MTAEYKIQTPHVNIDTATGEAREALETAKKQVGFVPNMYRGMAITPGLLSTYLHGYDKFRSAPEFTPQEQEVVFMTISRLNGCNYCTAAHSMIALNASGLSENQTDALRTGNALGDAKLDALATFTEHMWQTRGLPTSDAAETFKSAGYEDRHILAIILGMAVKTISNFSNHVTHPALDPAFAEYRVDEPA